MLWLSLGILSGLFHSLMGACSKKALKKSNQYTTAFAYAGFSLPFLLITLFWLDLAPVNFTFWWATLISSFLSVFCIVLFMRALSITDLSLALPFLSLTPVFLIFTSKLMLGEFPTTLGILGILLIVSGAYVLELNQEKGVLGPFRALRKNKGIHLILIVAFIYAFSSNFNKIAILNSNPITYLVIVQTISALIFLLLIYFKSKQNLAEIKSNFFSLLPIGLFVALSLLAQMTALTLSIVPYIISLKRSSALFAVILGFLIFKEKNIKPKLLGAAIMVFGVFLIAIS
jgi:uncharacterized membrane protein